MWLREITSPPIMNALSGREGIIRDAWCFTPGEEILLCMSCVGFGSLDLLSGVVAHNGGKDSDI